MKYLLVLVVVMIAIGIWRNKRRVAASKRQSTSPARSSAPRQLQNMVACAHCGLHLPQSDAVPGKNGAFFCSHTHRELGAQPAAKS